MLPCQPEFQSNQHRKLIQPFSLMIMLYMEFDENWQTEFRDILLEPWHGISNNVVCATSKASDQPGHMRSLIRASASLLNFL